MQKSYQYLPIDFIEGPAKEIISKLEALIKEAEDKGWKDLYLDYELDMQESEPYCGYTRDIPICYLELRGTPPKRERT